ncbi:MAG: hypothetical protein R3F14_09445 [Polyangiaceae bacterium]
MESYFLKANEPGGERALWLRATLFSRASEAGGAVAEGWAIAFGAADGRSTSRSSRRCRFGGLRSRAAGSGCRADEPSEGAVLSLQEGRSKGLIARASTRIAWDLRYEPTRPAFELLPYSWMYGAPFPKSKLVTPAPDAVFSGEVEVGDERWSIDGWRGMQGHNWGRGNADLYAWCQVNLWDDDGGEPLVLEAVSARVRTGPVLLPLLTLAGVRARGVDYRWNRPSDMARAEASIDGLTYRLSVASDLGRLDAELTAEQGEMVGLYYANPTGPITHCYNTKLARARVTFAPAGRPEITRTSRVAALEIGTHDRDPGVAMLA